MQFMFMYLEFQMVLRGPILTLSNYDTVISYLEHYYARYISSLFYWITNYSSNNFRMDLDWVMRIEVGFLESSVIILLAVFFK